MGFMLKRDSLDCLLEAWAKDYDIYAPVQFAQGGRCSDTACVRYGRVRHAEEIVFAQRSENSFKEILRPVMETLFFFTENEVKTADAPRKGAIIFLRSCDLSAVQRLDAMYLENGPEDVYYQRLRQKVRFVLMGCSEAFEHCFCVSMGTNKAENYDLSIDYTDDGYLLDCKTEEWNPQLQKLAKQQIPVQPAYVRECPVKVKVPDNLSAKVAQSKLWESYDKRCEGCGRCNFVCPTCTCFTMQDLFYTENGKAGERRRVWSSCMVDGFTDVAGGGSYRKQQGERMRFKVLHKVLDFRQRFGYDMCVGCGRCDAVCPEYISFAEAVNCLGQAMKEAAENE